MKLTQYIIYESSVSAVQEGARTSENIMKKLYEKLKKRSFVYGSLHEIVTDLNQISPKKIRFEAGEKRWNLGKYLAYAYYQKYYTKITILVRSNTVEYFRRFAQEKKQSMFFDRKKNQFYKELYEILSHELVHKIQQMKGGMDALVGDDYDTSGEYFSLKHEIDAFAIQAALQIIHSDRSSVWDQYSSYRAAGEITDKVYNRFMKKVTMNIKELQKLGLTK